MQQKPALVPKRKPAPPTLAIPAPTHQARYQPDRDPDQESQALAEHFDRRQKREAGVQQSARHQGWNPLKTNNNTDDGRSGGDLERQDEAWPYSRPRGWKSADDRGDRRFFIFLVIVAVVIIVVTPLYIKKPWKKG